MQLDAVAADTLSCWTYETKQWNRCTVYQRHTIERLG